MRRDAKFTKINHDRIQKIRTLMKKFAVTLTDESTQHDVNCAFKITQSALAKGVKKGVIHRNTASRRVSRMSLAINKRFAISQ